jgi:flagellin
MAITLGANIASLNVTRQMQVTSDGLRNSYERLSSGQRVNRGKDDAAGLSIAASLANSTRLAQVAIRNSNDGISVVSIADGALSEIANILSRQAELASQASNGFFGAAQRSALQNEFSSLGSEVERIAVSTNFNGINLLSGTQTTVLQVGFDTTSVSQITIGGIQGTLQNLGLAASGSSALLYSLTGTSTLYSQSAARAALEAVNSAISSLATNRGALGALESRLQATIQNLSIARENYASAESRIKDVDIAEEAANLARLSVLQQAGAAILAQANQSPQLALQLLR